jgi:hypothetical protein
MAYVTPIYKKDEKFFCKNYRPISLLPCLSKVFERCVFKEVYNFLLSNKKISHLQAAYSPKTSTDFQLLEIYHIVAKAMEQGKATRFVFLDVSKAFDRVWHEGLLYKLKQAGIDGKLLSWFKSYLSNRKQRVLLNGTMSDPRDIKAGVPQGSILGPLLFLVYINDIVDVTNTNIRLYADDSTLFVVDDSHQAAAQSLNRDLENITAWAKRWFITFNPSKTESLIVSRKPQTHIEPLLFNGVPVTEVKQHKHLGCTLQHNLKWNMHIDDITSKCTRRIDILRGLKYRLDRKCLETLYTAYIRPILEYASSVWTNCNIEQKNDIEKVQLAASRVITGAIKGTSHNKIYNESKMISTLERRERNNLVLFYKIYHGHTPKYLHDLLPETTKQRTNYDLRNRNNLSLVKANTTSFQNSYIPITVKQWNNLDENIRFIGSLLDFKHHLKKDDNKVPIYYYTGDRPSQIVHARMRMGCSPLKHDLHTMHILDHGGCECGHEREDCNNFFL